jgi:hypothetical protein
MEVTYELNQRDFFDALIAHRNRSVFKKWSFRLAVSIVSFLVGVGLLQLALNPKTETLSTFGPLFVFAVMWVALLWASPWLSARKQFSKQPGAQGPRTLLLDGSGVHWRWNGGSADVEWKNFIRFVECKTEFLLYTSPACFNMVPKRVLTPDQISELRDLFAQNVPSNR